jgi:hypothetical protein
MECSRYLTRKNDSIALFKGTSPLKSVPYYKGHNFDPYDLDRAKIVNSNVGKWRKIRDDSL